MAFNPSPQVAAARDFARANKSRRVVIVYQLEDGRMGYASYGKDKQTCDETKQLADTLLATAEEWWMERDAIQNEGSSSNKDKK